MVDNHVRLSSMDGIPRPTCQLADDLSSLSTMGAASYVPTSVGSQWDLTVNDHSGGGGDGGKSSYVPFLAPCSPP